MTDEKLSVKLRVPIGEEPDLFLQVYEGFGGDVIAKIDRPGGDLALTRNQWVRVERAISVAFHLSEFITPSLNPIDLDEAQKFMARQQHIISR